MRTAIAICVAVLVLTLALGATLVGCQSGGNELPGSTYCDPTAGSSLVSQSAVPSGSCKGTSTCIAFTAGDPCADPTMDAGECEWTCSCVDDTWACTSSCSTMCGTTADGPIGDAGQTD